MSGTYMTWWVNFFQDGSKVSLLQLFVYKSSSSGDTGNWFLEKKLKSCIPIAELPYLKILQTPLMSVKVWHALFVFIVYHFIFLYRFGAFEFFKKKAVNEQGTLTPGRKLACGLGKQTLHFTVKSICY